MLSVLDRKGLNALLERYNDLLWFMGNHLVGATKGVSCLAMTTLHHQSGRACCIGVVLFWSLSIAVVFEAVEATTH